MVLQAADCRLLTGVLGEQAGQHGIGRIREEEGAAGFEELLAVVPATGVDEGEHGVGDGIGVLFARGEGFRVRAGGGREAGEGCLDAFGTGEGEEGAVGFEVLEGGLVPLVPRQQALDEGVGVLGEEQVGASLEGLALALRGPGVDEREDGVLEGIGFPWGLEGGEGGGDTVAAGMDDQGAVGFEVARGVRVVGVLGEEGSEGGGGSVGEEEVGVLLDEAPALGPGVGIEEGEDGIHDLLGGRGLLWGHGAPPGGRGSARGWGRRFRIVGEGGGKVKGGAVVSRDVGRSGETGARAVGSSSLQTLSASPLIRQHAVGMAESVSL